MGGAARDDGSAFVTEVVEALRAVDAAGVALMLRSPHEPVLLATTVAVTPLGSGSMERVRVDDGSFTSARVYRTGRTLTKSSMDILAGHPELSAFAPFPYAVAATPVHDGGERPVGTLTALWNRPYSGATEEELAGLTAHARRISLRLAERAQAGIATVPPRVPKVVAADGSPRGSAPSTAPHLYHLHKLAVRLAETADTGVAVRLAVERLTSGFGGRAAVITWLSGRTLRVMGQSGCSEAFLRELDGAALGGTVPETAAVDSPHQRALAPDDPRAHGRLADGTRDAGAFWVLIPLLSGRRVVGTCSVAFDARRGNLVAEQSVLTALATLLGQALERTRMLGGQHALAARLQRILLPSSLAGHPRLTSASRYLSATTGIDIGGDWYEMIRLPGGGVALVIGDVEGHNVSAAVVMGQLRSAMRAYAAEGHGPGQLLTRADRLLVGLDTDLFATCCCVALDPATGTAEIASAGHPPPLLRTPAGLYPALDVRAGPPLGVSDSEVRYPVRRLRVDPGSLLALYTDGLAAAVDGLLPARTVEAGLAAGQGLEALCDRLTSPATAGPHRRHDDAALLLVRYEPPPTAAA